MAFRLLYTPVGAKVSGSALESQESRVLQNPESQTVAKRPDAPESAWRRALEQLGIPAWVAFRVLVQECIVGPMTEAGASRSKVVLGERLCEGPAPHCTDDRAVDFVCHRLLILH